MKKRIRSRFWFPVTVAGAALVAVFSAPPREAAARSPNREQAVIELGRRLFMDPTVSHGGKFSCADCHDPEHGFSDARVVSEDENGRTGRHSQTVVDIVDGFGFHWDGEFDHLHELLTARLAPARQVMLQTRELAQRHFDVATQRGDRPSRTELQKKLASLTPPYYGPDVPAPGPTTPLPQPLVRRLEHDGRYSEAFREAYGSAEPTTERLIGSMKAYMLSLKTGENRFDEYLAGRPDALTKSERRGLRLFDGKAGCAQCHTSRPTGKGAFGHRANFTDYTFRNTGVAFRRLKLDYEKRADIDAGLGKQTFAGVDIGSFKVPSLRDIARRAPYMHDGTFKTLESVVDYYEHGGTTNGRIDNKLKTFRLTVEERADLVAFMHALTSKERAGLGAPAPHRVETIKARLIAPSGRPVRALPVKITPFGDRLRGSRGKQAQVVTTDAQGFLEFRMPLWTHVKLSANGYEIGYDRPIPDTVRRPLTLLAAPRRLIHVEFIPVSAGRSLPATITARIVGTSIRQTVDEIEFKRVRRIPGGGMLYAAPRRKNAKPLAASFQVGKAGDARIREIDPRGGSSEPIDFRRE